jgi:hypothetical protein
MARVPITVMGFRCERCGHEWIPRGAADEEPRVCPRCRSPWWYRPKKTLMTYEDFKNKVATVLEAAGRPMTWTEVRTAATLSQAFPNNQWVHRLERDIGLIRRRQTDGIIHWQLSKDSVGDPAANAPTQTPHKVGARSRAIGRAKV